MYNDSGQIVPLKHCNTVYTVLYVFYLHFRKFPPKSYVLEWQHITNNFLYVKGAQWDFVGLSSFVCL